MREVGRPPEFDFEPRDHLDLGTALGSSTWRSPRAPRARGSPTSRATWSCSSWRSCGWPWTGSASTGSSRSSPPVLVREEPLFWTGFLPTDRAQIYEIAGDDLYLVGTSEVSLAALHADEILAEEDLPLRYGGFSTCFRREAGAAGKDTRGIFRVHQFDKVEMFSFVRPEDSADEHERLLSIEERILRRPRDSLPGGEHRRRRPGRLRREEVRLRGVAARARAATAS